MYFYMYVTYFQYDIKLHIILYIIYYKLYITYLLHEQWNNFKILVFYKKKKKIYETEQKNKKK